MDPEIDFFFFLAAVICLALATVGSAWRHGARTRRGLDPSISLIPLGLALAMVPLLADAAEAGF
jgi:hypothetical protein